MCARERFAVADASPPGSAGLEAEVVEIPVLLPGWQAQALESAARCQGMTAGQMVRRLIRDFCRQETDSTYLAGFVEG